MNKRKSKRREEGIINEKTDIVRMLDEDGGFKYESKKKKIIPGFTQKGRKIMKDMNGEK
ncbi:MAG: hypothetical protein U5J96_09245 [Ignavibacteriaceae bacterium]|nr:hypothetical protein [Ignavibacteriaceae bacterium]